MKPLERELRRLREPAVPDPEQVRCTIERSKAAFYAHEARGSVSWPEFLYQQSRYIHRRWWALQGGVLLLLWWMLSSAHSGSYVQRGVGVLAPVFVVLLIPELWKNRSAGATEVECTTFYTLRQMYAARLTAFALVDLLLLSGFWAAVSLRARGGLTELVLQFFLPFTGACCICFRTLCCKRHGSEMLAVALCLLWTAVWVEIVLNYGIYERISRPVWCALLLGAVLYLICCAARAQRESTWEGALGWN